MTTQSTEGSDIASDASVATFPDSGLLRMVRCRDASRTDHALQARACLGKCGDQNPTAIIPGTDERHPGLCFGRHRGSGGNRARGWRFLLCRRILQQHAQRTAQPVVCRGRFAQREPVRNQRIQLHSPRSHQVQHRFKIALLGPAHQAERIVMPGNLVAAVIPPRSVGARHLEGQFLLVEIRPAQFQTGYPDKHDPAALARHLRCLDHRFVRGGGRCYQDRVHSPSARKRECSRKHLGPVRRLNRFGAELASQFQTAVVQVDAQHAATLRPQHLHGQKPYQAQTDHRHGFSQRGRREPDTLKPDGPQHREGCIVIRHAIRHLGRQILSDSDHLGVVPVRDDPVTGRQSLDRVARLDHGADIAVAQRNRLIQFRANRVDRRGQTVRAHLLKRLAHLVRLLPRLVDPVRLAEFQQHPLGPDRDQAAARPDKNFA